MPIRLVLADDHPGVLRGLERLFSEHEEFRVLQCCRDGDEALAAVRREQPDVLLLDLFMPNLSGFEVLQSLINERLACRVVVLAAVLTDEDITELFRLGAISVVRKDEESSVLLESIRCAHLGLNAKGREADTPVNRIRNLK
jgi:DNA-binding NarL/FixJ family response regulator